MCSSRRQAGMSLIEVVVFIVVVGIALAGILALFNQLTRSSVDPMIRKQALAIASSMLEEIELRGSTYCDPDDANVYTATSTAGCTSAAYVENIGPDTLPSSGVETRYADPRFDNVNDYHNFAMGAGAADPNIRTIDNTTITALANYNVSVVVAQIAANEVGVTVPTTEALRITVTASHPSSGIAVSLQGYRLRYAPNTP